MSRRVLSLLLALAMVLSMVPVVGSADTGDRASLSAQVEQTESQAVVHIDYRIPDRTFTAGKSYYFVAAAYDTDEKLVGSGPCLSAAICRRTTAFACTFWMRGMCPCATPCGQAGPKTARMR